MCAFTAAMFVFVLCMFDDLHRFMGYAPVCFMTYINMRRVVFNIENKGHSRTHSVRQVICSLE